MNKIPSLKLILEKTKLRGDARILIQRSISGCPELVLSYKEYRAAFLRAGTTVNKWAKGAGISSQYVYDCLKGARKGPASISVVAKVNRFLGII